MWRFGSQCSENKPFFMYDFYEFLGSGIIAARTGRPVEAFKYLSTAAKIKPNSPRVNLWLASVAETFEQQKQFLEKALKIDPNLFVIQALLEQLSKQQIVLDQQATNFIAFTCQYCGGIYETQRKVVYASFNFISADSLWRANNCCADSSSTSNFSTGAYIPSTYCTKDQS